MAVCCCARMWASVIMFCARPSLLNFAFISRYRMRRNHITLYRMFLIMFHPVLFFFRWINYSSTIVQSIPMALELGIPSSKKILRKLIWKILITDYVNRRDESNVTKTMRVKHKFTFGNWINQHRALLAEEDFPNQFRVRAKLVCKLNLHHVSQPTANRNDSHYDLHIRVIRSKIALKKMTTLLDDHV